MSKLVEIMDAVMSERNRIPQDKTIGQQGDAVVEEAVEEVPRGGRRQRLLRAPVRMLHQVCSTLRSLLEDLARSGATITSSGEVKSFCWSAGHFFQVAVTRGIFYSKYQV